MEDLRGAAIIAATHVLLNEAGPAARISAFDIAEKAAAILTAAENVLPKPEGSTHPSFQGPRALRPEELEPVHDPEVIERATSMHEEKRAAKEAERIAAARSLAMNDEDNVEGTFTSPRKQRETVPQEAETDG